MGGEGKDDGEGLSLAEVVAALSHALDLTEGQPPGHCVRSCRIAMATAAELGMTGDDLRDVYYAVLLKDLGCSSNAARICELYLADDIAFKSDWKHVGSGLPAALRFVLTHTGLKAGLRDRFAAIANILRNGGDIAREMIETRCSRGGAIARRMRFPEPVALGIGSLDEHHDGGGKPVGLAGADIPMASRLALLAQVADVFHLDGGAAEARREVASRSGTWFDPDVVAAFGRATADEGFWTTQLSDEVEAIVVGMEPGSTGMTVDEDLLDDLAGGFAMVVDGKSPFTGNHSERVAFYAEMVGRTMGLPDEEVRVLRRAGLLHDVGKLAVPNSVLDKPGKPDEAEWASIRAHPGHGERILSRVPALRALALVAGAHHERLDGRGYPRGVAGDAIPLRVRIMSVADVFDALTADRPYRAAMAVADALAIMRKDVGAAFDAACLAALEEGVAAMTPSPGASRA